jgi:uncharacterized membrane protein
MTNLIAAALAFLALHLVVSGTRVRDVITGAIGQGPYMGLFSLASLVLITWLSIAFGGFVGGHAAGDAFYWSANVVTRSIQLVLQLFAFLLAVAGLSTPNPGSVGQTSVLEKDDAARGILRVTRHPFLWGAAIWAAGHLLVNGHLAALIFFGTFLVLALFGTISIDAKRERAMGDAWNRFAATTSNVPFAAIAAGRQSLNLGEIGALRLGGAVIIWVLVMGAHQHIFGTSALPLG